MTAIVSLNTKADKKNLNKLLLLLFSVNKLVNHLPIRTKKATMTRNTIKQLSFSVPMTITALQKMTKHILHSRIILSLNNNNC